MHILICTVGKDKPASNDAENGDRLVALERLLDTAKERASVDLVVLPGGFFFSSEGNPRELPILQEIRQVIEKRGIAACFGVDTAHKQPNDVEAVKECRLSSLAFAWTPQDGHVGPWRQRSTSSQDQKYVRQGPAQEKRNIHVDTQGVALLICGELFNPKIRAAVQAQGIAVAVDMAHRSKGFRFARAAKLWSSADPITEVLMSSHAKCKDAVKCWSIRGEYCPSRKAPVFVPAPVRIEGFVVSVE
jgi:hypothetical protein